jgi:hypothetical protein
MKHILFKRMLKYTQKKELTPPKQYEYDHILGSWVNTFDKSLLIASPYFQRVSTKKFVVETGEDHKGQ